MSKKDDIVAQWRRETIEEINKKAGRQVLDPNETDDKLIQDEVMKHLHQLTPENEEIEDIYPDDIIDYDIEFDDCPGFDISFNQIT